MISIHLSPPDSPAWRFTHNFKLAETRTIARLAELITDHAWSACFWQDGSRRQAGFLGSDFMALDFEDPEYSLKQAVKEFCDCVHVIGVTRNHQKSKDGAPPIDRFRVLVPWERRIDSLNEFRHNMMSARQRYPIDVSCVDGARFFYPCTSIISLATEGYKQEVTAAPPTKPFLYGAVLARQLAAKRTEFRLMRRLAPWVEKFLREGDGKSGERRHHKALGAAIEMVECGVPAEEVFERISKAPISRPYQRGEVAGIVQYALKELERRLNEQ